MSHSSIQCGLAIGRGLVYCFLLEHSIRAVQGFWFWTQYITRNIFGTVVRLCFFNSIALQFTLQVSIAYFPGLLFLPSQRSRLEKHPGSHLEQLMASQMLELIEYSIYVLKRNAPVSICSRADDGCKQDDRTQRTSQNSLNVNSSGDNCSED